MRSRNQENATRWSRAFVFACMVSLCVWFAPAPAEIGVYFGNPPGPSSATAIFQKDSRQAGALKAALPFRLLPEGLLAGWDVSFFKADRQQNLRLWPVLANRITRSPPSI